MGEERVERREGSPVALVLEAPGALHQRPIEVVGSGRLVHTRRGEEAVPALARVPSSPPAVPRPEDALRKRFNLLLICSRR